MVHITAFAVDQLFDEGVDDHESLLGRDSI
jgi:hypothetical protein